ncbi:MAG: hypothetical protein L6R36_000798 [Xanthoria steineri]|nr:MAG: hypothetical protein L6R36_000798 [Xanthoria steineri]
MADPIEKAKETAARKAVEDHFDPAARYIGIGSGSTIVFVVQAIKDRNEDLSRIRFVPTGYQSRQVIVKAGLQPIHFDSLPSGVLLDVAFDGADEVDEELNCIKGGGACLYQEKLVATHARKFICVADERKLQSRLLSKWDRIPIEVEPLAAHSVLERLAALGSQEATIRSGAIEKSGPIKTDQDNFIVDAKFKHPLLPTPTEAEGDVQGAKEDRQWAVETLAKEIKQIEGVLSVGLFCGENGLEAEKAGKSAGGQKPVAAYFGMEDGSVVIRKAGETDVVVNKQGEEKTKDSQQR